MNKALLLAGLIPLFSFTCNKKLMEDKCYEVKVVRITCASFVVQVLNDNRIGEDGWKDMMNNEKTYDNVINITNKCDLTGDYKVDDVLMIRKSSKKENECVVCMMYDAPPKFSVAVDRCE